MNKNVKSEIAIGIILVVAIIIGIAIWLGGKQQNIASVNTNIVQKRSPAFFKLGNTKIIKTQTIDKNGGEIKIENSQTPLDGFVISFPLGAFEQTGSVSIGYNNGFFDNLPSGKPTGKTIVIMAKGAGIENLESPISISFSSDSKHVLGYAIDSDGHIHPIDTVAYKPLVINYTFIPETTITWVYVDSN